MSYQASWLSVLVNDIRDELLGYFEPHELHYYGDAYSEAQALVHSEDFAKLYMTTKFQTCVDPAYMLRHAGGDGTFTTLLTTMVGKCACITEDYILGYYDLQHCIKIGYEREVSRQLEMPGSHVWQYVPYALAGTSLTILKMLLAYSEAVGDAWTRMEHPDIINPVLLAYLISMPRPMKRLAEDSDAYIHMVLHSRLSMDDAEYDYNAAIRLILRRENRIVSCFTVDAMIKANALAVFQQHEQRYTFSRAEYIAHLKYARQHGAYRIVAYLEDKCPQGIVELDIRLVRTLVLCAAAYIVYKNS